MRKGLSRSGVDGTGFFHLSYISGGGDLRWTSPPTNDEDAASEAARARAAKMRQRLFWGSPRSDTETEEAALAITGRPIPQLLARSQFHRISRRRGRRAGAERRSLIA